MFRWPAALTPLSLGGGGLPREALLEVSPRGAAFTLAALSHVGHAAHLALVDAFLKGQLLGAPRANIGNDSRTVVATLATPLLAAHALGIEHLTLGDLILLPRPAGNAPAPDRAPDGTPVRSADCARLLLRRGDAWHAVRGNERFEAPGCLGTRLVGAGEPWYDVLAELPSGADAVASDRAGRWPAAIQAEVRAPSGPPVSPTAQQIADLRALALGRFARSPALVGQARRPRTSDDEAAEAGPALARLVHRHDLLGERRFDLLPSAVQVAPASSPAEVVAALADHRRHRRPAAASFEWRGFRVALTLAPDLDGHQTLCLLPPPDVGRERLLDPMREAAWATVEALVGRPLAEYRVEPFSIRLVASDRTTTLEVGGSIVVVRNQTVFAGWVGSDGRVMLKLLPPGGMATR